MYAGKSCTAPASRGPSSRRLSAGTYADWGAGVTIRLSSDICPWPAVRHRIRGTSVRGWMAYGVAGVGESSRRLARGQKESQIPSLAPGSLAIGRRTGGSESPAMPSYLSSFASYIPEGRTLYHQICRSLAALSCYEQASRFRRSECTSIPRRCIQPTRNTLSSL